MDFAGYCLFEPIPCNVAKGNEKGKVESGIKFLRGSFLAGYSIVSWPQLQRDADAWRDGVANLRIHGTTRQRPIDRLPQDQAALRPLPERDYDTSIIQAVKANSQAFVSFDANTYSVPWELARASLTLKATPHVLRFFNGQTLVAEHFRSYEKYLPFEKPAHRSGLLASRRAARAHKNTQAFQDLSVTAKAYLAGLVAADVSLPHHLQKIWDLIGLYGKTEVLQAIEHALSFKAFGAPYLQNIILQQRSRRGLPEIRPLSIPQKPQWADMTIEESDLSLYDQLFEQGPPPHDIPF